MKRIKWIEVVTVSDLPKAKVIESLATLWKKYIRKSLRFSYNGRNGGLESRQFNGMVFSADEFNDEFSDNYNVLPVKIHYRDGSWEYGIKWWEYKDVVYQRNRKLVPLFVKRGYVNYKSEEVETPPCTDRDSMVPAWILDLLPRYNEKARDSVNDVSTGGVYRGVPTEDWRTVNGVVESGYVTSCTKYSTVKTKNGEFKAPAGMSFGTDLKWDDDYQKQMVVPIYSYMKSIYENIYRKRRVYTLIPISDLLIVTKESFVCDRDRPNKGCWVEDEVWNNLDQTVAGNV